MEIKIDNNYKKLNELGAFEDGSKYCLQNSSCYDIQLIINSEDKTKAPIILKTHKY